MSDQLELSDDLAEHDETVWISLAKEGDRAAFSQLVLQFQRPVYNLCYQMLHNRLDAEDAAQEVFIRAYFKFDTYDDQHKFSTWLFSIASHYCIDRLKRRRVPLISWADLPAGDHFPAAEMTQPENVLLAAEATREVRALLEVLRPDYRAAVVLKYWYNMSYDEIAQTLDTTVSTVRSRLFRARRKMAQVTTERQPANDLASKWIEMPAGLLVGGDKVVDNIDLHP